MAPNGSFTLGHTYPDNGSHLVTVAASDDHGHDGSFSRTVSVTNAAPVVSSVTAPAGDQALDTSVTVDLRVHRRGDGRHTHRVLRLGRRRYVDRAR